MDLTPNREQAIYVASVSPAPAMFAFANNPGRDMPDGLEMSDLNFLNPDSKLFNVTHVMSSAGQVLLGQNKPCIVSERDRLDSNFKCNTDVLSECLDRRQVSEAFSGCGVVGPCDVLDIAFGELAEADFPGQASADDAICVFDRASLPGGMRITEEGPDRQCLVAVEFATVVEGDGLSGFWGHAQEQVG